MTPKIARELVEQAGQVYGTVTATSKTPNPGTNDYWVVRYRVTPKSVRKTYDDLG